MEKVDSIFKEYLHFKPIILLINNMDDNELERLFSKNALEGFEYLTCAIFGIQCRNCTSKAIEWLEEFKKTWLLRKELPIFYDCECIKKIENCSDITN